MKEKFIKAHMRTAFIYSELSHCVRRKVGCVIVKDNRIISIGYNGLVAGGSNVCELPDGTTDPKVLHAESNAITKLAACTESGKHSTIFTTTTPCLECAKLIASIGVETVYYSDTYHNTIGLDFLNNSNIETIQVKV